MQISPEMLRSKGWNEQEIEHATRVLKEAELNKNPLLRNLEIGVFWALLAILVIGIFAVSMVLVPILLLLDTVTIAIVLILLGLSLGALYSIVVRDIEWLQHLHHNASMLVLMAVAGVNIWIITEIVNRFGAELSLGQTHHPLPLAIVFAISLIVPFFHHLLIDWWHGTTTHAGW